MHADAYQSSKLECPRCGYGITAAADAAHDGDSRVTCSECGLQSSLWDLERGAVCPPWFIESDAGRHGVVVRFLRTAARAFAAHRFWSVVRLAAPVSRRGIAAYLVGLAITLHLGAVAAMTPIVLLQGTATTTPGPRIADLALVAVLPLCPVRGDDLMFAATQGNPNRSIDGGALWRAATAVLRLTFMRDTLWLESVPQGPNATGPYAVKQAGSSGRSYLEADRGLLRARSFLFAVLGIGAIPFGTCALVALLPVSLRRAKVRGAHLVRGCVYACAFMPAALALSAIAAGLAGLSMSYFPGMTGAVEVVAIALMLAIPAGALAFSAIYLDAFCTRYLLLPRGRLVAATLHLITLLAVVHIGLWLYTR